ncbi:MAG: SPOR domain-containing protein, partial [Sphingobium sp.]|nr:SPOR domain-containing protein [Sphingobium sp.]
MSDYGRGRLDFDDEDRLPWLEPAIDDTDAESLSPLRLLGLILLGLILVGAVVAGVWWVQNRNGGTAAGEGQLITAPTQDYKIAANEADAKTFDGEGDASFAASEGVARDGRIDPSRVPEAPITKGTPAPTGTKPVVPVKPGQSVSARVTDGTSAAPAAATKAATGGAMIQLGAYGSAAGAKDAWSRLS